MDWKGDRHQWRLELTTPGNGKYAYVLIEENTVAEKES